MKTTGRYSAVLLAFAVVAALGACSDAPEAAMTSPASVPASTPELNAPAQSAAAGCIDGPGIAYICGIINGEDMLRIGTTPWVLVSGMNGELGGDTTLNGKIHLVNAGDRRFDILFPGAAPLLEHDVETFAGCPGPLDVSNFSAHGLALQARDTGPEQYRLYMTSHGAREAIEVFEIDALVKPTIKWVGCVPMPITSWTNSLVILHDGGFLATQFMDPTGSGMAGVIAKELTGHVFEWHPGGAVSVIAGTELSGPNGIAMSDDERFVYVAAFGTQELVRFDRSSTPPSKESVALGIAPDNVRWSTDGTLYTAGGNITEGCGGPDCGAGWSVWEVEPALMTAARLTGAEEGAALGGVSSALLLDAEIWVGTYGGDRIAILPKP
ncbi:MAG: hypothetical protein RLZZ227_2551 [Pseudomonadota bacterium]|jgi:hypothetical protein